MLGEQPFPQHEPEGETSVSDHYAALTGYMVALAGDLLACHFGLWGPDTTTDQEALLRSNQILLQGCGFAPGQRVLDAGCGVGGMAIMLAETYGVHVTGLTVCEPHIAVATEQAERRGVGRLVEFLYGDFYLSLRFCHQTGLSSVANSSLKRKRPRKHQQENIGFDLCRLIIG